MGLGLAEARRSCCTKSPNPAAATAARRRFHFYVFPPGPIIHHGSEEMKRKYLPKLATGEMMMCFGVTEPTAASTRRGSRPSPRRTTAAGSSTARRCGSPMRRMPTGSCCSTRTAPRDDKRPFDGMTLFFCELDRKRDQINADRQARPRLHRFQRAVHRRISKSSDEDVVGEVGQGLQLPARRSQSGAHRGRVRSDRTGPRGAGQGRQYAKERIVFDRPIGKNQAIAHPLADSWIRLRLPKWWR